ncbi:hypothetical protein BJ912DRAFT_926180 [Pholiota molesta]|nr:hypothetical protein BJ912DRAFT_926180 [Pholiota molesta]
MPSPKGCISTTKGQERKKRPPLRRKRIEDAPGVLATNTDPRWEAKREKFTEMHRRSRFYTPAQHWSINVIKKRQSGETKRWFQSAWRELDDYGHASFREVQRLRLSLHVRDPGKSHPFPFVLVSYVGNMIRAEKAELGCYMSVEGPIPLNRHDEVLRENHLPVATAAAQTKKLIHARILGYLIDFKSSCLKAKGWRWGSERPTSRVTKDYTSTSYDDHESPVYDTIQEISKATFVNSPALMHDGYQRPCWKVRFATHTTKLRPSGAFEYGPNDKDDTDAVRAHIHESEYPSMESYSRKHDYAASMYGVTRHGLLLTHIPSKTSTSANIHFLGNARRELPF